MLKSTYSKSILLGYVSLEVIQCMNFVLLLAYLGKQYPTNFCTIEVLFFT